MNCDVLERLKRIAGKLREPENLFSGQRLPPGFKLPDNILVFHNDFIASTPNAHGRYTVVIPLGRMIYFIERERLELSFGDVLIIPPHSMRYIHPDSESYGRIFITFELQSTQTYISESLQNVLSDESWKYLMVFLKQYEKGNSEESSIGLFMFLKNLKASDISPSATTLLPIHVSKSIAFIGEHLASPIGNAEVAEAAGLSESHLRSIFRKHIGISPGQYIARQRLDAAKHRLIHTTMSIAEIARSCGYRNIYVFSYFFKNNLGLSPTNFRKRNSK